jgi:E1A/CREB-binding protein
MNADLSIVRMDMVEKIIVFLKTRRSNATGEWLDRLPHLAERLDEALYHIANSYEEYTDSSRLKFKLKELALSMSPQRMCLQSNTSGQLILPHQQDSEVGSLTPDTLNMQCEQKTVEKQFAGQDLNGDSVEHKKRVLKQQQQRLLLLRHASKCPHSNGTCPVTPHCFAMKQLWKHIIGCCKEKECEFAHCISSRYVLKHYSSCKDRQLCPVCGPVREIIKRNYEHSKTVVNMIIRPAETITISTNLNSTLPLIDQPAEKKQKIEKATDGTEDKVNVNINDNQSYIGNNVTIIDIENRDLCLITEMNRIDADSSYLAYSLQQLFFSTTDENEDDAKQSSHEIDQQQLQHSSQQTQVFTVAMPINIES